MLHWQGRLSTILKRDDDPTEITFQYEYIIIDEAQDLNPNYYLLLHKIIKDNGKPDDDEMDQLGVCARATY